MTVPLCCFWFVAELTTVCKSLIKWAKYAQNWDSMIKCPKVGKKSLEGVQKFNQSLDRIAAVKNLKRWE